MVMAAVDLLEKNPTPNQKEIRDGPGWKSLPLHRLHEDLRVGSAGVSDQ
jgi:hypothetical protein